MRARCWTSRAAAISSNASCSGSPATAISSPWIRDAPHLSRQHKKKEFAASAPRRRSAPGPGTRAARFQSDAPHTDFATAIEARSVDRECRRNGARPLPTSCSRSPAAGRRWRSPPCSHSRRPKEGSRRPGLWPCYRSGSTRCGGLASQDEGYGLFVPGMLAEYPRVALPASVEQFRQLGWCESVQASGEMTNSCRPAANTAQPSMRAPQVCSFYPLTNNNTSHSRASSMHLTQWLDQTSAVGSLLGEIPGQSIQKI